MRCNERRGSRGERNESARDGESCETRPCDVIENRPCDDGGDNPSEIQNDTCVRGKSGKDEDSD
jgi:hypothetical protein